MTRRAWNGSIAIILLCASACTVIANAPYDPAFDAEIIALRKDVDAFFDETAACVGTPYGSHSAFAGEYRAFDDRLAALRGQALRHQRNEPTVRSLDMLRENFGELEAIHRDGLIPEEVPILRTLIDTQLRLLIDLERAKRGAPEAR